MELCELAAKEQDDEQFNRLILEVSRILKEKKNRFKHRTAPQNEHGPEQA